MVQLAVTERWSSVDEVAKHLGVAQDSIYRGIEGRGLPAHKIGRLWKFKLSEVDVWVRAGGAGGADGRDKATATPKTSKSKRRKGVDKVWVSTFRVRCLSRSLSF